MRYLCFRYYDQKKFDALSKSDLEAVRPACLAPDEALRNSGRLILVGPLALPPSPRTVRPADGRPSMTDGPYAETDEPLGAFFMVEAQDLDEAVEVASKHPGAHLGRYFGGGIEVRPIDMPEQPTR
jgi:hypothetical protein